MVELGELANETRCFKFWSVKPASHKKVILEEYVDGLHFILGLAIELNAMEIELLRDMEESNLTLQFRRVFYVANQPIDLVEPQHYINQLFTAYYQLGEMLEFTWEEIEQAYMNKNQINHARQNEGY